MSKTYKEIEDHLNPGNPRTDMIMDITDSSQIKHIPTDPKNADWTEYQEWLDEGNTPEAWDA